MTFRGHVRAGVVVFDDPADLPEGTAVEVWVRDEQPSPESGGTTLLERLKSVTGKAVELPPDASTRIDHYLTHGLPGQ